MFKKRKKNNVNIKFNQTINLEEIVNFINENLQKIIYSICFILFIIFIYLLISNKKKTIKINSMNEYYKAYSYINEKKNDEAITILKNLYESKKTDNTVKTISGIRYADLLLKNKNFDEAHKIYINIYKISKTNTYLKYVSGLAGLNILINKNDKNDYLEIEKLIKSMSNKKNPLINLLKEQEGIFEIQRKNKEKGIEILEKLLKQENIDLESKTRIELIINLYK